jgi:hypothetical protein
MESQPPRLKKNKKSRKERKDNETNIAIQKERRKKKTK